MLLQAPQPLLVFQSKILIYWKCLKLAKMRKNLDFKNVIVREIVALTWHFWMIIRWSDAKEV